MKPSNKEKQRVHDIIKYDVYRKYFGDWNPKSLNNAYNASKPVSFYIGILSVDKICDTLWKEMSYNPERFGSISPFKFNGKNSLDFFINKEIDLNDENFDILTGLQSHLSRFLELALKYDKSFMITNRFKSMYVIISTKVRPNMKPIPSATYRMLGHLRACIHKIATQNIQDLKKAKYRDAIIEVAKSRYPEKFTPIKTENVQQTLEQYLSDKSRLENAVWDKNSEILDTESRIDTLNNEFENPGDTSTDIILLQKQNEELKKLEKNLQFVTQRIQKIKQQQYEH